MFGSLIKEKGNLFDNKQIIFTHKKSNNFYMSQLIFIGTNTQLVWQNEQDIPNPEGKPPEPNGFPSGTTGSIRNYNPYNGPIQWTTAIPSILTGLTVDGIFQLLNKGTQGINNFSVSASIVYTITSGSQAFNLDDQPNINLNGYDSNNTNNQLFSTNLPANTLATGDNGTLDYCTPPAPCPSFTFNEGPSITGFPSQILQVNPWNDGIDDNFHVVNFTLQVVMTVTLTVTCMTGPELGTSFCMSYCNDNVDVCKAAFDDFCFASSGGPTGQTGPTGQGPPIATNTACQLYYEQLYRVNGPDAQTDAKISSYCQAKYTPEICFNGLFNATPAVSTFEINLCACHLPQECYDNYKKSLEIDAPGFVNYIENSGINERCLVSQCASSPFPSIDIGDKADTRCAVPACITVVNFNNNGSIGGGVTINASNTCQQIASGNDPNNPFDSRTWIWLLIGAIILVFIIIIFLWFVV